MKVYTDIRLADPFLRPYWRHERVLKMLASVPPERCRRYDDAWVQGYKKFLFSWRRNSDSREQLVYDNAGMYYAYMLFDRMHIEPEMRLMIEARLLAGVSYESIAQECKTVPATIEWYERLFFNVADFLPHHDWIMKHVLLPATDRFAESKMDEDSDVAVEFMPKPSAEVVKPHLDMTLKFFAYFGGPLICDMMISGFRRTSHITNHEDIPTFFNDQFASQIARRSAQAAGQFEINKYNVMELFVTHSRLIEISKSVDNVEDRHNAVEKHINAMLSELPWTVGVASEKLYAGTPVGAFDSGASELNEEEVMIYSAGLVPNSINGVAELTISSRKEPENNAKPK